MAAFCKQCNLALFGEDYHDFADATLEPGHVHLVICEGCGRTEVDAEGKCVRPDCLEKHGDARETVGEKK